MRAFVFSLLMMVLFCTPAHAADSDAGLYAPKPPAGSTFIRFFNQSTEPKTISIGGKAYETPALTALPYHAYPAGGVEIGFSEGQSLVSPYAEGQFYTVITDDTGYPLIHKDHPLDDPAKALIVFYNLGDKGPLTLKAQDGTINVVDNAAMGKSGWRRVNPGKVDFAVFSKEGEKISALDPIVMERGFVYSVFFSEGKAVLVKGETDPTPQ